MSNSNLPDGCKTENLPGNSPDDLLIEEIAHSIDGVYGEFLECINSAYGDFIKNQVDEIKKGPSITKDQLVNNFAELILSEINGRSWG